jgi:UDPglucose 6-dehydrogenase
VKRIAVIGTGYVGLVTGTCLAETGNNVLCVDIDEHKVNKLKSGSITIYEPQLDVYFERNLKQGRLTFSTQLADAVNHAEIIFLALPTPPGEDGSADLSYILGVAKEMGHLLQSDYKIIVDKSTVPVGTAEKVHQAIAEHAKADFDVVSNPEFLREGFAVEDFMKPDRVVIGTSSARARKIMEELYLPFVRQGNPILFMDERSAELTKYAANSFLAMKISFMNEMANLCELLGADVDQVRIGIGSDQRIGKRFLFPGIGYGGSCFPKDVTALVKSANEVNFDFRILKSVMQVNHEQKSILLPRIKQFFNGELKGKRIAIWGLAFKPDTDDIREAPALHIIDALIEEDVQVLAYDPEAMENVRKVYGNRITFSENQYAALENADALVICTEWAAFRNPDFEKMHAAIGHKVIFDGRNLYSSEQMKEAGLAYYSIGRKPVKTSK